MRRRVSTASLGLLMGLLALGNAGCGQQFTHVKDFSQNLVDYFTGNTALNAAKMMEDQYFPDERRIGINKLADRPYGLKSPYTDRYQQIATLDSDYLVRATAIRALNRARDPKGVPTFIAGLKDTQVSVRLESAKALANIPDASAVAPLIATLNNPGEDKDVRIAAAGALRHYRQLEVARALIAQLQGRDFSVSWQANRSLRTITGKNLKYDESAWLNFVTGPDKPFG